MRGPGSMGPIAPVDAAALARPDVRLDDRYSAAAGPIMASGIQAIVRLLLDQRRLDIARGLRTGIFVSGYQGSPLGGLDLEIGRASTLLDPLGVVFTPGLNEELAATAVAGTQLLGQLDGRHVDGVTGFWFGKAPGLDRAADAIRHGNVSGTAPLGGAVALIGDDPAAKSSTVPSSSEPMCRSLMMPVLAPGSVEELLELGLHAVALSRHSGLWVGLKITADVADATAVFEPDGIVDRIPQLAGRPSEFHPPVMLPPTNVAAELDVMTARLERAAEYARAAGLNRVVRGAEQTGLAVVAAGAGHQAVLRALDDLGLDERATDALGLRVVQLRMPWPLAAGEVVELVGDVERVLVVEDKLPFVESLLKEALYGQPRQPLVVGKRDEGGQPLLPAGGMLTADDVEAALGRVLGVEHLPEAARARVAALAQTPAGAAVLPAGGTPARTPFFCGGCPHNAGTRADPSQLVGVGIGCHVMVALDGEGRRGQLLGMPQMGGEGAQWFGLAPFTGDRHFIQNLGDGTFHHSGSLAIRAAVAAGVNITFKLLYNDAVAMTGGQQPQGKLSIPALTRWLAIEGVQRVVVTTPEPERYRGVELDPIASVSHRDDLQDAQRDLAAVGGVTVIVHDDQCAIEQRRARRRGDQPAAAEKVFINERVCEGCGDCGEKSTCMAVQPVDTEFGRKTRIDQTSCGQDLSCVKGDCPSFLMVTPAKPGRGGRRWLGAIRRRGEAPAVGDASAVGGVGATAGVRLPGDAQPPVALTAPTRQVPEDVLIHIPGIGGTGVVTISQILQMAAHLDGRFAAGLEQTGLSQKGGPVISDIRLSPTPIRGQLRATRGGADVLLGFDLLGAATPKALDAADPARTIAVVSTTKTPTASMVSDPTRRFPSVVRTRARIDAATRARDNLYLDAGWLAERLFHDHLPANMLVVGAAFQHGCLPLSAAAIEHAIELNGVAVAHNLAAFRWGRAAAIDAEAVEAALSDAGGGASAANADSDSAATSKQRERAVALAREAHDFGANSALVERRAADLVDYQDAAYAAAYVSAVAEVARRERAMTGATDGPVTRAFAQHLYKLLAYKDEYEIARLHLDPAERARVADEFGPGAKVQVLLQPPILSKLGINRKLRFGRSAPLLFRTLRPMRRLRGTRLDPFGHAAIRRLERALPGEYQQFIDTALDHLRPDTVDQLVAIAELPDMVRGYEDIKLANVERYREQAAERLRRVQEVAPQTQAPAAPIELPVLHHAPSARPAA